MNADRTDLYTILACPVTGQRLRLLEPDEIGVLNQKIASGAVKHRGGAAADTSLDGGLATSDADFVYPIFDDLPYLLPEDAIRVS